MMRLQIQVTRRMYQHCWVDISTNTVIYYAASLLLCSRGEFVDRSERADIRSSMGLISKRNSQTCQSQFRDGLLVSVAAAGNRLDKQKPTQETFRGSFVAEI